jgi:hypothetical protein
VLAWIRMSILIAVHASKDIEDSGETEEVFGRGI